MDQRPNPMPELSYRQKDRFWSLVHKTEGCWLWCGQILDEGYGRVEIHGKNFQAHRISFFLTNGFDPGEQLVLHECDIRRCVKPDHLFLGTKKDNTQDAVAKGRHKCFSSTNQPTRRRNG